MNKQMIFEANPASTNWELDGLETFDTEQIGEEWESEAAVPMPAVKSQIDRVWVFADKYWQSTAQRDNWFQIIKGLQVTDVVLVVNDIGDRTFRLRRNPDEIVKTAETLQGIQVDTHLMTWLYPFETYIRDSARVLLPLCGRAKARSILFDVESNWTRQSVNHERVVGHYFDRYYANAKCYLGVTSIASVRDSVKPLIARCHYVLPQAYSTTVFGCPDPRRCVYDPGVTQRFAHDKWKALNKPIVMGLAAYMLRRPGNMSQREAMQRAYDAVISLSDPAVHEVAYWSLKWLFNQSSLQTAERMRFVAGISQRARAVSGFGSRAPLTEMPV